MFAGQVMVGAALVIVICAEVVLLLVIGSKMLPLTEAVFVTKPGGASHVTRRTSVNTAVVAGAMLGVVHEIVPPESTGGVVQVQPPAGVRLWNVMPFGIVSVHPMLVAVSGPLFVTVIV